MDVNLRSLIGKFNQTTRNATEAAAGLCLTRTHYNVEVEHYLSKLLESTDGDFAAIAKHYGIDKARFSGELTRALDRFKTGNGRTPTLSPDFVETMTNAWTIASIDFGVAQIRTGFTVLALTSDDKLSRIMREISKEFPKISAEDLRKDFFTEVECGARNVDNILTNTLLPELSMLMLERIAEGEKLEAIQAGMGEEGAFVYS
jgi:type VI secretion system protein VasG